MKIWHVATSAATALALVAGIAAASTASTSTQAPTRQERVDQEAVDISAQGFDRAPGESVAVVTGSSTVRMWAGYSSAFPTDQAINTGFQGSTMSDLLDHYHGLIGRFEPDEIVIGSGDNDLAAGRSPAQIIGVTNQLLDRIGQDFPDAQITLVAAKPSIRRWDLRDDYVALNEGFRQAATQRPNVTYVDMWNGLLDDQGGLRPELYRHDGLHLNQQGYRVYSAAVVAAVQS